MNLFSLVGLLLSTGVFIVGLRMASPNLMLFVDGPSVFIVIGGTFAAMSISFQLTKIGSLFKIFFSQYLKSKSKHVKDNIKNIMQICEGIRAGESLDNLISKANDPFLRECLQLISDGILENEKIMEILKQRANQMNNLRTDDAKKIKSLGKFPPAFGMMGTTIGMIVLLANLGGADAMKMIGPAMGVCLITTLYGCAVANLFLIPVGENIEALTKESEVKNKIILEGVKHILAKSNPVLIAEDLNSFLLPGDRLDWRSSSK